MSSRCYVSDMDYKRHFSASLQTHYVPASGHVYMGRWERALCGKLVTEDVHAIDPTCPRCAALTQEYENAADFK